MSRSSKLNLSALFLRAVLIIFLLNLGRFVLFNASGGYSPALFQDGDEPYYLLTAQKFSNLEWSSLLTWQDNTLAFYKASHSRIPHQIIDFLLIKTLNFTGIRPVLFLMFLDVLFFLSSYLILTLGFNKLLKNSFQSEAAAFVMLLLPWFSADLLSLWSGEWKFASGYSISSLAHSGFRSLPHQRGIYTQLSYLPFTLAIYHLLAYMARPAYRNLLMAGLFTGISIYCYFFAWLSLLVLIPLLVILRLILQRELNIAALKEAFLHLLAFAVFVGVLSAPGLSAIFQGQTLYAPGAAGESPIIKDLLDFRKYWFFSPQGVLLALALIIFTVRQRTATEEGRELPNLCALGLALLLAELLLMNTQAVANAWMTPYHFPLFFLHPLLSAVLAILLLRQIKNIQGFVVTIMLVYALLLGSWKSDATYGITEYTELLKYIDQDLPSGSTVISMPVLKPFAPVNSNPAHFTLRSWIGTLGGKASFPDLVCWPDERLELVQDEVLTAWIYSGLPQLLQGCNLPEEADRARDLLTGSQAFYQAQHLISCELLRQNKPEDLLCAALQRTEVNYIVWDQELELVKPAIYADLTTPVWQSSAGKFSLLKFDQPAALAKYCPPA